MLRLFFSLFAPLRLRGKHSYKNKNLRTCYTENTEVAHRNSNLHQRLIQ